MQLTGENLGGEGCQEPTTDQEVKFSCFKKKKKENCRAKIINSQIKPGPSGFKRQETGLSGMFILLARGSLMAIIGGRGRL